MLSFGFIKFKMSSDSDREELFKILTAYTTVTKDNVLEFSRGLEKNMPMRSSFFRTLPLRDHVGLPTEKMAMLLVPEDLPMEPEIAEIMFSLEILLFSRNRSQLFPS